MRDSVEAIICQLYNCLLCLLTVLRNLEHCPVWHRSRAMAVQTIFCVPDLSNHRTRVSFECKVMKAWHPRTMCLLESQGEKTRLTLPFIVLTTSSGRSTPVPQDAPPSVQSISSARKLARARAKNRLFHTINYEPRVSHFDPNSEYRDFRGFFILFWISLTIMVLTTVLRNVRDTGYPLRVQMWKLLSANVVELGFSDLAMVVSTGLSLPLQRLFRSGIVALEWRHGGFWIQSAYQALWLAVWVEWPFMLNWTWTAQVFFALHTLTFLMKMHSYAFYNGHLGETERRLRSLDTPEKASYEKAVRYPSSPARSQDITESLDKEVEQKEKLDQLRQDLATELTSPMGRVTYRRT